MAKHKVYFNFTLVMIIIGFMFAIQYQSSNRAQSKDTRTIWELRQDLLKSQELHQTLLNEIEHYESKLKQYEINDFDSKITLNKTNSDLRLTAGLSEVYGEGILITVNPVFIGSAELQAYPILTADLLTRLINQINKSITAAISVGDERIILTSPIRDVNEQLYVNHQPLPSLPIEIKVIGKNAKILMNSNRLSPIIDEFIIENLEVTLEYRSYLKLPAYYGPLFVNYIEVVENIRSD